MTSPNLTIQCMNAYIQGSAGFTCAKPNHTNFKSAHCPLWTTCSLCSSSDHICALWFPHRSNSKSQNLCGKLIQPSLWRSSLVIDTHSSSQWKSAYVQAQRWHMGLNALNILSSIGLCTLNLYPKLIVSREYEFKVSRLPSENICCKWSAPWCVLLSEMKKTKIQTNKIFARHLPYLPVSAPCDFFPLPPNEIQTQRRTGVLEAAQHSWLDLPHCIQMLQSSSLLTVWLWGTNLWCTTSLLNLLVF